MRFSIYFVFAILLIRIIPSKAQESDFIKDEGEIVEGEFQINKELEISLPSAQRIFKKVLPDEINATETEAIQYTFKDYAPPLNDIKTRLRVLKLKDPKITSKPDSYIKIGIGNYLTPYLDASLNSGKSKTTNYGLKLNHLSSVNGPVDGGNSGDSHTNVNLFGKFIGRKASIGGDLGYARDGYRFYGYDTGTEVSRDTIKQTFNNISIGFNLQSNDAESTIQYKVFGRVNNTSDKYEASELAIKTGFHGKYILNDIMQAKLEIDYLFANYKNPAQINRSLVRVYPSFMFSKNAFTFDVGIKVVNNNDTLNSTKTQIFPALNVAYELSDNITAYGSLDGDVEEVTFNSIVNENPYINSNQPIAHTNKNLDIQFGLKGSVIQNLAFDLGVRTAIYKNMYFYVNDPNEFNKFSIIYDRGNTSLFQGFLSLSYYKGNNLGTMLSLRANAYNTGELDEAWHRPTFEFDYSLWYIFYDKIKLTTDLLVRSGIKSVDLRGVNPISNTLSGAVDLNLKIEYMLSKKYSAFVSVNNLLNNNYQLYNRYQTRGLLAIVGFSVSF